MLTRGMKRFYSQRKPTRRRQRRKRVNNDEERLTKRQKIAEGDEIQATMQKRKVGRGRTRRTILTKLFEPSAPKETTTQREREPEKASVHTDPSASAEDKKSCESEHREQPDTLAEADVGIAQHKEASASTELDNNLDVQTNEARIPKATTIKKKVAAVDESVAKSAKDRLLKLRNQRLKRRQRRQATPAPKVGDVVISAKQKYDAQLRKGMQNVHIPQTNDQPRPTVDIRISQQIFSEVSSSTTRGDSAASYLRGLRKRKAKLPKLPSQYNRLLRAFIGLESALNVALARRPMTAHFDGMKSQVESYSRCHFTLKELAQIMTVYPDAYQLSYEQENLTQNVANCGFSTSSSKSQKLLIRFGECAGGNEGGGKTHWLRERILTERQREFEDRVVERVRVCHRDWLAKNDPDITEEDLEELPGDWHFEFESRMDKIVPSVPLHDLPKPPLSFRKENARRKREMLQEMRKPKKEPTQTQIDREKERLKKKGVSSKLQGINLDLVAKVRLRDAQNRMDKTLGGPELRKLLAHIEGLSYLIDLIRSALRARGRRAMKLPEIVPLLVSSHRNRACPPSVGVIVRQVRLLAEIVPKFCQIKTLSGDREILKVDLKYSVMHARKAVKERLQKERNNLKDIENQLENVGTTD